MTRTGRQGFAAAVWSSLILVMGVGPVAAQSATNSARIEGRVTDETAGSLPGVSVIVSSPALQAPQLEAVTDADGRYRIANLPGGVYKVVFTLSGFQKVTRDSLNVDSGFVATLDTRLTIGQIEESVTVTGLSPMIDVRSTTVAANIKKELMETIPTSRSYADVGKLAPGIRLSGVPDVGGSQTGGQRGNLVSYGSNAGGQTLMLDGINTDGTAGYFDFGSIEEMIVRPAGNDPEIPTSGMAFQVIVKSGSNQFHGNGLIAGQSRGLQGNNIDDRLKQAGVNAGNPMDHYYDLNASLGGRIVKDRLWFFGSGRRKEYGQDPLGFAGGPGADGRYFTTDDEQGQANDRESNLVDKFTGQFTTKHRFSWMNHYGIKATDNRNGSVFIPHEAAAQYSLPHHTYKGDWTYTPTNRSVLLVSVGRSWYKSQGLPYTDAPSTFDQVSQRYGGAAVNSVGTGSDAAPAGSWSQRWQYDVNYTYFKSHLLGGDHEFKMGLALTREWYNRHQDIRGAGTGGVGHDYQLIYSSGVPFEVLQYNTPFESHNNVNNQGGYLRDSWRATDRLTLDLGVRVERYHTFLPPQSKEAGPFSQAASYPEVDLYDWRGLAPRIGVAFSPAADNRTVIKGTYGRYNFALRPSDTNIVRNLNGNEYVATLSRWSDLNGNGAFDANELGSFVATQGGSTVRAVYNPNVKQPKADEVTLTFERQLAASLTGRVGYVFRRESGLYQLVNTARSFDVYNIPINVIDPGPDGRNGTADDGSSLTYFDYAAAYKGPAFEQASGINTPDYTNRYHNIEAGVDKRLSNRWQLLASFLGTKKDVWIAGVPQTPNDAFFPKDQTWDRTFRVAGSYQAPWGILGSMIYEYQSGTATARDVLFRTGLVQLSTVTLRMEPLGSERLPSTKLVSLRAEKRFQLSGSRRLAVQFDVYNALNANDATGMSFRSGPTYGQITAILPPRVARFGFSYAF
jgi:hypothetical protein